MTTVYRCEWAWIGAGSRADVDISVDESGRISSIDSSDPQLRPEAVQLPGLVLPGFANGHSHAFHRALRGRTHGDGGTFWTWRERMYEVAAVLDPELYYELARAVYGEMALAGVACVGEFHYVHHAPDGSPYDDPNAMGEAVRHAARDAGLRLTLLDTCYLAGGLESGAHVPLSPRQARFGDGDAARWARRFEGLNADHSTVIGAAIHSVRAVPSEQIPVVVQAGQGRPLHAHLSEQLAENAACEEAYGLTPTGVLARAGALGPMTTVVHATHLTGADIGLLGSTRTSTCFCPTTERDLADGIGPAMELSKAGSPLCLGSDQNAVMDLIEEARALEMHERLQHHERGRFTPSALVDSLTVQGHTALGWSDAGRIEVGQRADLVAIRTDTVRTAGSEPEQVLYSATVSDVDSVVVDGRLIASGGRHRSIDVSGELQDVVARVWARVRAS
ncbi:MAG: formimidoylglutamate deiminase [Actinobacteria bacterium]|nr:formimidoylglutamate deiminase [Actinomycetota bacterium]